MSPMIPATDVKLGLEMKPMSGSIQIGVTGCPTQLWCQDHEKKKGKTKKKNKSNILWEGKKKESAQPQFDGRFMTNLIH